MKDLQDYLESISKEELDEKMKWFEDDATEEQCKKALYLIKEIIEIEIGQEAEKFTREQLLDYYQSLKLNLSLYGNIQRGHIIIKSGRIKLFNGGDTRFSMTDIGREYVENNLLPKLK